MKWCHNTGTKRKNALVEQCENRRNGKTQEKWDHTVGTTGTSSSRAGKGYTIHMDKTLSHATQNMEQNTAETPANSEIK